MEEDRNAKSWERINPKLSFRNFFIRILQFIESLKYGRTYFFDSNMIVLNKVAEDKRIKKLFALSRNLFVTNIVNQELPDISNSHRFIKIFRKNYKIISFDDLREKIPEVCVYYHSFIRKMSNPANIFDINFFVERQLAFIRDRTKLGTSDSYLYERIKTALADNIREKKNVFGEEKTRNESLIDEAFHYLRKKNEKDAKNSKPNSLNDVKNLALILTYCLIFRKNCTVAQSRLPFVNKDDVVDKYIAQKELASELELDNS